MKVQNHLLDWSREILREETPQVAEDILRKVEHHVRILVISAYSSSDDNGAYALTCEVRFNNSIELLSLHEACNQNWIVIDQNGNISPGGSFADSGVELVISGSLNELAQIFNDTPERIKNTFMNAVNEARLSSGERISLISKIQQAALDMQLPSSRKEIVVAFEVHSQLQCAAAPTIGASCSSREVRLVSGKHSLRIFPHRNKIDSVISFQSTESQRAVSLTVNGQTVALKEPFDEHGYATTSGDFLKAPHHIEKITVATLAEI